AVIQQALSRVGVELGVWEDGEMLLRGGIGETRGTRRDKGDKERQGGQGRDFSGSLICAMLH
ncbi:MAG TPA: hypothetical protein DD379_12300, partial [Cyanobacteria bacterium UBA11162]|nr:hypothetical protein [Cyanobacteria bacterium UBA11162]